MSPDQLFSLANALALLAWSGLLFLPHVAAIRNVIAAAVIPCLFATAYKQSDSASIKEYPLQRALDAKSCPALLMLGPALAAGDSVSAHHGAVNLLSLLWIGGRQHIPA